MLLATVNDKIMHGIYSKDRPEVSEVDVGNGRYEIVVKWNGKQIQLERSVGRCKRDKDRQLKYIGSYMDGREYFVYNGGGWTDLIIKDSIVEDGYGRWANNYWLRDVHTVKNKIYIHTVLEFEGYIRGYVILRHSSQPIIKYKNLFVEDEGVFSSNLVCLAKVKEALEMNIFEDLKKLYQLRKRFRFLGWADLEAALGSDKYLGEKEYYDYNSLDSLCGLLYDAKIQEVILSGFSHPVMRLRKAWKLREKVDSYEGHRRKREVMVRNDSITIHCCRGIYIVYGEYGDASFGECDLLYELSRKYRLDQELNEEGLESWAKFLKDAEIDGREVLDES